MITSPFYYSKLETKYIVQDSYIVKYRDFENGVVKIQDGEEKDLTITEKHPVRSLLVSESNQSDPEKSNVASSTAEGLAKKRYTTDTSGSHIDCIFIFGSVAKVERLWSIGSYVLASHRQTMTPQIFEAIVFIRENERFWDAKLVAKAIGMTRIERVKAKIVAHQEHGMNYNQE